jgi:hypothetical protein
MAAEARNKSQAGEGLQQAGTRISSTLWHTLPVGSVMKQVGAGEGLATEAEQNRCNYGCDIVRCS